MLHVRDTPIGDMSGNCLRAKVLNCGRELGSILDAVLAKEDMTETLLFGSIPSLSSGTDEATCVGKQLYRIRKYVLLPEAVFARMIDYNQGLWGSNAERSEILKRMVHGFYGAEADNCHVHKWYNEVFMSKVGSTLSQLDVELRDIYTRRETQRHTYAAIVVPSREAIAHIIQAERDRISESPPPRAPRLPRKRNIPRFIPVHAILDARDGVSVDLPPPSVPHKPAPPFAYPPVRALFPNTAGKRLSSDAPAGIKKSRPDELIVPPNPPNPDSVLRQSDEHSTAVGDGITPHDVDDWIDTFFQ